jgi:uncharacterized protein
VIVYFDTSALVKLYFAEADSEAVLELWSKASLLTSSQLLYAEMGATFARKRREQAPSAALLDHARKTFLVDWVNLVRIALDDDIHRRTDDLLGRHPLRGADAVHLASALLVRDVLQEPLTFACADVRLIDAARAEGLLIAP